jgi:hypothetical protein
VARAVVARYWRASRYWRELVLSAVGERPAIGESFGCQLLAGGPQLAGSCVARCWRASRSWQDLVWFSRSWRELVVSRYWRDLVFWDMSGLITCGDAMLFLVGHASVSSVGLLDQSCVGTIAQSGVRFITQLMSRIDAIVPRESSREIASSHPPYS